MKKLLVTLATLTAMICFSQVNPVNASCSYYAHSTNVCCKDSGEGCKYNGGNSATEWGDTSSGDQGGCPEGQYLCQRDFYDWNCSTPAEAKAICGTGSDCKGQNQGCGDTSECCSGLTCNNGVCSGSCTGNEPDQQTCTNNKGNWVSVGEKTDSCSPARRLLTNGQYCIAAGGIGSWCKAEGCSGRFPAGCGDTGGCGAAGCVWIPDSTIPNITCSYCSCPSSPPPQTGCTNSSWNLSTWIGFGTTDAIQQRINGLDPEACKDTTGGMYWSKNASVNIPAYVSGGNVEIKGICTMADSPSLNNLNIADVTQNVTIATGAKDEQKFVYRILAAKKENPGKVITIRSSRATAGAYCAKTDDVLFCASNLPEPASNGSPNGGFINDTPPASTPEFDSKGYGSSPNGDTPLSWSHTITSTTNKILLVGISYRGDPKGDNNGDGKPDKESNGTFKVYSNNTNDGDADDYVRTVTLTRTNGTVVELTRVPNSHSQFIEGNDPSGKRHTVWWYMVNPPTGANQIRPLWKGSFPDRNESIGGSIAYTNFNSAQPFNLVKNANGKSATCSNNVCASGEPSITLLSNKSQVTLSVIASQTDKDGNNPASLQLQTGLNKRWKEKTSDNALMGQGVDIINSTKSSTDIKIDWKYGYSASWAISGLVLNGAINQLPNNLYWQNLDWGNVCGQASRNNYVTLLTEAGSPVSGNTSIAVGENRSLNLSGRINLTPKFETTYKWYVETTNLAGTLPDTSLRKKSTEWRFKVRPGINLVASSSASPIVSIAQNKVVFNFRIVNTGGYVINNAQANYSNLTNNVPPVTLSTSGTYGPWTLNPWWWADQGGEISPLPPPGNYTIRIVADPGNVVAETDESDNFVTLNYTVPPRDAYFQVTGAGISSLGSINSDLPTSTDTISKKISPATLDAGIISARNSPIGRGLGIFSQNGVAPGWNRTGAISSPRLPELGYNDVSNDLLKSVLSNAGINSDSTNLNNECAARGTLVGATSILAFSPNSQYKIFCYGNNGLTEINAALATIPNNTTGIFVPYNNTAGTKTMSDTSGTVTLTASKKAIVFVNYSLLVNSQIVVSNTNDAGLVIAVNGNITVADTVNQLDGLYIFNGQFNSNSGATLTNQLTGNGSLIGTGTGPIVFSRTFGTTTPTANPAESWTYQPKYLWLFRDILVTPSYSWKELPPQ